MTKWPNNGSSDSVTPSSSELKAAESSRSKQSTTHYVPYEGRTDFELPALDTSLVSGERGGSAMLRLAIDQNPPRRASSS